MATTIWKGKSPHNSANIMAALSYGSGNRKTGAVDTLWILAEDVAPHHAVASGADSSVCGDCPHRRKHGEKGDCYVLPFQAPLSVWKSAVSGTSPEKRRAQVLRLGGYGDPAMLPESTVAELAGKYPVALGYSHQWRQDFAQWAKRYCMASADSLKDKAEANAKGWRTFRVTYREDLQPDEILCPATTRSLTCEQCKLCQGTTRSAKNIVILAHGTNSKRHLEV